MAAGLEAARSSSPSLEDLEAAAQTDIVERAPFITSIQPEAQSQPSDRGPSAAPPGQIEPPVNLDRRQSIVVTEHAGAEMLRRFRSEDLVLDAERRSSSWRERSRSRSRMSSSRFSIAEGGSQLPPLARQSSLQRADTEAQLNLYATLEGNSDLLTTGPTKALWSVWTALDRDGSGTLNRREFNEVNRRLRVGWDRNAAWRNSLAIQQLHDLDERLRKKVASANQSRNGLASEEKQQQEEDEEKSAVAALSMSEDPQITFRAFVSVYNQMMGATRRSTRQNVKAFFEDVGLRGLRRQDFERLVRRVERRLYLLPPRFEAATDWALLLELSRDVPDEGEESRISFVQFERWWKYRCGLLEADTPVIPEFFEFKMAELSTATRVKAEQERRKLMQALPQNFTLHVRGASKSFDVQQLITSGFNSTTRPGGTSIKRPGFPSLDMSNSILPRQARDELDEENSKPTPRTAFHTVGPELWDLLRR